MQKNQMVDTIARPQSGSRNPSHLLPPAFPRDAVPRRSHGGRRPALTVPPHAEVQPITEAQFDALVRFYEVREAEDGARVYTREGYPWQFVRQGDRVKVEHRYDDLPAVYYTIVRF